MAAKSTATKNKPAAAVKADKAPAETTEPKKAPAARDAMGCRTGSQSAAINACIGSTAKTVATLATESGATPARVSNHVRYLLAKELIEQTDDGYTAKAPAKAAPAKRTAKAAK